jgi:hypothetical protein
MKKKSERCTLKIVVICISATPWYCSETNPESVQVLSPYLHLNLKDGNLYSLRFTIMDINATLVTTPSACPKQDLVTISKGERRYRVCHVH